VCFVFIISRNNVFSSSNQIADYKPSADPSTGTDMVSDVTIIMLCERTQFDADAHGKPEIPTTISLMVDVKSDGALLASLFGCNEDRTTGADTAHYPRSSWIEHRCME
jgi:hypothetical protein